MDERRDTPPGPGSRAPISTKLSPVQAAHADYSTHTADCQRCGDIDRDRCEQGDRLWKAWKTACDDAYERLRRSDPMPGR